MTKIQNPIIGRARGSAGGMTFAKNYDKNVMRSKPFEVKNPKTQGQTTQRDFFKEVQTICASVSDEELRSLFGDMPKGMSRRNALSKQIAAAYSTDGTSKVVDFSKLQAIGNGTKVYTPIQKITDGAAEDIGGYTQDMFPGVKMDTANSIVIVFDSEKQQIIINNMSLTLAEISSDLNESPAVYSCSNGYCYLTCAADGSNVYNRGFGSFIIKTRAEKTGRTINKGGVQPGDVVTLSAASIGSTATLNFANYDFNNLEPGDLIQGEEGSEVTLIDSANWVEGSNNEYAADLEAAYDNTKPIYLQVLQNNEVVDTIPFSVVVE